MNDTAPARPGRTAGMRHVALYVQPLEACLDFYSRLLGMEIEWQPDADNVYLCSGNDNLALHRSGDAPADKGQRLDHIGFILPDMEAVDAWFRFFTAEGVKTLTEPKTHRDGARSFYCEDPAGTVVQLIYHPPIAHRGAT